MKMARRDFLNVSTGLRWYAQPRFFLWRKPQQHNKRWRRRNFWNRRICTLFHWF